MADGKPSKFKSVTSFTINITWSRPSTRLHENYHHFTIIVAVRIMPAVKKLFATKAREQLEIKEFFGHNANGKVKEKSI